MITEPLTNIEIWGLADHEMPEPDPGRNILDEQQPIKAEGKSKKEKGKNRTETCG